MAISYLCQTAFSNYSSQSKSLFHLAHMQQSAIVHTMCLVWLSKHDIAYTDTGSNCTNIQCIIINSAQVNLVHISHPWVITFLRWPYCFNYLMFVFSISVVKSCGQFHFPYVVNVHVCTIMYFDIQVHISLLLQTSLWLETLMGMLCTASQTLMLYHFQRALFTSLMYRSVGVQLHVQRQK